MSWAHRVLPFSLPLPVQSPCTESFIEVGGSGWNHLARSSCCFDTTAAGWTAFARFEIGLSTRSLSVHWTRGVSSGVPTGKHSVDSRPSSSSRREAVWAWLRMWSKPSSCNEQSRAAPSREVNLSVCSQYWVPGCDPRGQHFDISRTSSSYEAIWSWLRMWSKPSSSNEQSRAVSLLCVTV